MGGGADTIESGVRRAAEAIDSGAALGVMERYVERSSAQFLSIDATGVLATTVEFIATHMNMKIRRTSPFPAHLAEAYDRIVAAHSQLSWPAPVCGAMRP